MCTPHYGSPEILREEEIYNENCDVWSCGVLMYEIIEKKSIYEKHRPKNKS
jgi:serine/threonine protein kinase